MMKILIWSVGILFAISVVTPRAPVAVPIPADRDAQTSAPSPSELPAGNGMSDAAIARSADGHFYADAKVNGATVHFLIDTGATTVALTRADAQAAGVQFAPGDFTSVGQGVGGTVALKPVTLDRVAIGAVEARDVEAVVADSKLNISLLGQSWLARVGTVTIKGDQMVLR
jgi:aspartyl protease family protein